VSLKGKYMLNRIPFLTASWEDLVVINYAVDPAILNKYVPRGTELDLFNNKAYVSLVAFRFNRNRLFGLIPSFPCYSFEEVNLRFYIRRGDKRAVAFIKEVVPSSIIAGIARLLYQEPYEAMRMTSKKMAQGASVVLSYSWGDKQENSVVVDAEEPCHSLEEDSLEEFILEHYWGYTRQADGGTIEYQVRHPKWKYGRVSHLEISENIRNFYGPDFTKTLSEVPSSVLIAKGSEISVSFPKRFFHPLKEEFPKGYVLYDAKCGFCSWWIPFCKRTINNAGYDIAPLQSDWVRERLHLNESELANDIRVLLSDGTRIDGADAYIHGIKQLWWSFPVGMILGLPGFRQLTWLIYRFFNRNRFLLSKMCRL